MKKDETGLPVPESGMGFCTICAMAVKGEAAAAARKPGASVDDEILYAIDNGAQLSEAVAMAMSTAFGGQPVFVPLCWVHMMGIEPERKGIAVPNPMERAAFGSGDLPPGVKLLGKPGDRRRA